MNRCTIFAFAVLLCSSAAFAQTQSDDSQTLQSILAEVHQLRIEMRNTTIASQRVQILLFRVQSQETAVQRATNKLDDARSKLAETQTNHREMETRIKQYEDGQGAAMDPAERKAFESALPFVKSELERMTSVESQQQNEVSEAEEQARVEQAKLNDLQTQLSDLDKSLENAARAPVVNH